VGAFKDIQEEHRPRTSHISFLKELDAKGFPLGVDDLAVLHDGGELSSEEADAKAAQAVTQRVHGDLDRFILDIEGYLERCGKEPWAAKWKDRDIAAHDWSCEEPAQFTPGFVSFILSHYKRFCDLMAYEPFYLYMIQAARWHQEDVPDLRSLDFYGRRKWYRQEFDRYSTNSMYALWRELWYKEPDAPGGEEKYEPTLSMFFLCFLFDQKRSMGIAKGRHIASTTTFAAVANIKMVCTQNLHVKLIACDLATTQEIFEDKVKYGFGRFSKWVKPVVLNDKDNLFRVAFRRSASKGSLKAVTSKINITAPSASAINGGSPSIVLIDEAPFLEGNMFDDMMREGRPVLFRKVNGRLVMRRQFIAWGTGGRAAKGGGSFEKFHRKLFTSWEAGKFHDGIVPVMLDWTCRPGMTIEFYRNELARAMSGQGDGYSEADIEANLVQFRQTMPSSLDDVYAVNTNTLVSTTFIIARADKCSALPSHLRGTYGRFEPLFDHAQKSPADSFFPFRVKGVQWVPMSEGETGGPAFMFWPPERRWKFRYYQGTDPILSATGLSRHASSIWDAEYRTIPCVVNTRMQDPYDSYAQSKLMGMYYHNEGEEFCPELVENNIGKMYIKWICGPEWRARKSLVSNNRLMDILQGGGEAIGFDSKGARKNTLVTGIGKNMLLSHGKNIYIPDLWSQFRFFTGTMSKDGNVLWAVDDRKKHQDDLIDASFLAYANRISFPHQVPVHTDAAGLPDGNVNGTRSRLIFDRETMTTKRVPVYRKIPIENIAA
jgi:hypothetical protein